MGKSPSNYAFTILLLLGGDVVARALAQLAGGKLTPVAFSFGTVCILHKLLKNTFDACLLVFLSIIAVRFSSSRSSFAVMDRLAMAV